MSRTELSEEALQSLETGDFSEARRLYGELLAESPDDPDYICGLYSSGYWENRQEEMAKLKPGRILGAYIVREWDKFNLLAEEKGFPGTHSFAAAMKAILGSATEQFRKAFQEEGGSSADMDLLMDLGRTLLRIEDYKNAADIFQYARKVAGSRADIYFLLGEALTAGGQPENYIRGMSFYRDAFFLNPAVIDPSLITSEPASTLFQLLHREKEGRLEEVTEWMPAHMLAQTFVPGYRHLHPEEVKQILWETERLEREAYQVADQFKEKLHARLSFYYLTLLYHFTFHEEDRDEERDLDERLKEFNPELHSIMRESLKRHREEKKKGS